jgi:thiamine biosynthesis protein ThiS
MTEGSPFEISVNGKPLEVARSMTLRELILFLQIAEGTIAVGHNSEVVPKSRHDAVRVGPGDRIDIVHFVAGG